MRGMVEMICGQIDPELLPQIVFTFSDS